MVFQATISARNPQDMTGLKRKQRRGLSKKIGQPVLLQGKKRNGLMLLQGNKEKRRKPIPYNAHHVQCTIARNLKRVTYCNGKLPIS